jgi:hypothetical protein
MQPVVVRRTKAGASLVLAALVFTSGIAIGSNSGTVAIDRPTQAGWLEDHFRMEHAAELAGTVAIDRPDAGTPQVSPGHLRGDADLPKD